MKMEYSIENTKHNWVYFQTNTSVQKQQKRWADLHFSPLTNDRFLGYKCAQAQFLTTVTVYPVIFLTHFILAPNLYYNDWDVNLTVTFFWQHAIKLPQYSCTCMVTVVQFLSVTWNSKDLHIIICIFKDFFHIFQDLLSQNH